MQAYIGTKIINAVAMTLGAYNDLRNWSVPANENPAQDGYLVEYTDGGKPNVEGFEGYVSWSPADVFEKTYRPLDEYNKSMHPHQIRVVIEQRDVADRLIKLQAFLNTEKFKELDKVEQSRLEKQSQLMYELKVVLSDRIAGFGTK